MSVKQMLSTYSAMCEESKITTSSNGVTFSMRMARLKNNADKQKALQQQGTLNLRPQDVIHPLFQDSEFFDAHDSVQVKYEMLRRVRVDKRPISQAAKEFGFSRPSFYQAEFSFEQSGLSGLLPGKRGPQMNFYGRVLPAVNDILVSNPAQLVGDYANPILQPRAAEAVKRKFNLRVHPRSIERQLLREKKRP